MGKYVQECYLVRDKEKARDLTGWALWNGKQKYFDLIDAQCGLRRQEENKKNADRAQSWKTKLRFIG